MNIRDKSKVALETHRTSKHISELLFRPKMTWPSCTVDKRDSSLHSISYPGLENGTVGESIASLYQCFLVSISGQWWARKEANLREITLPLCIPNVSTIYPCGVKCKTLVSWKCCSNLRNWCLHLNCQIYCNHQEWQDLSWQVFKLFIHTKFGLARMLWIQSINIWVSS